MDALELPLPVAVKLSNTIEDVEPRKSESFPILTIATVSRFSSSVDYTGSLLNPLSSVQAVSLSWCFFISSLYLLTRVLLVM